LGAVQGGRNWALGLAGLAALAGGGYALAASGAAAPAVASLRHFLSSSVLAKSGFFAAFSLIFASEIGDKTFFIAALLAMRCGKWVSFVGSVVALSVMTVISVGIGFAVKSVPAAVKSSEVLGQWVGAALLVYFGLRTLRDAWLQPADGADELGDARESVDEAAKGGAICARSPWQAMVEVGCLIFVAEWGDRSMLATIALGAAQSPLGVAGGAVLGHVLATAIAVVGGAVASKYISEKTVGFIGGTLFLVFAAATAAGLF
jgi:putative Ca2+/H+ antiporter (TMEM165/GDT1 family)